MTSTILRSLSFAGTIILVTTASLAAQAVTETLPFGVLNTPGTRSRGSVWPFDFGGITYQEVHSGWTGKGARTLNGVAFRRAAKPASNNTAVARTAQIRMFVGYGARKLFNNASFHSNYVRPPSLVRPSILVNLPDWRNQPTTSVAPFDLRIPFTFPFQYSGSGDFVWEIKHTNPSVQGSSDYLVDTQAYSMTMGTTVNYGPTGCPIPGRTLPFTNATEFRNLGPLSLPHSMELSVASYYGPGRTNTYMGVGRSSQSLQVFGWCNPILVNWDFTVRIGLSQQGGAIRNDLAVRHHPSLIGVKLFTQAFASDKSAPGGLVLSDGRSVTIPADPGGTPRTWLFVYQRAGMANLGPVSAGGSVITGWY